MSKKGIYAVSGVSDSASAFRIARNVRENPGRHLVVCPTEKRARVLAQDISFFLGREVFSMPDEDPLVLSFEARSHDSMLARLRALNAFRTDPDAVLVAPAAAAVRKRMPHVLFENDWPKIRFGEERDPEELASRLAELGYERRPMVDSPGEFSLRGGILDVFVPSSPDPVRIEFFDTEVDSIRVFDRDTQRSIRNLKEVEIGPAQQILASEEVIAHASEGIRRAYTQQADRLAKSGREEASENLKKRRDELCEYIESISNVQLLENYLHYLYEDTEYLWDYAPDAGLTVEDPDRILSVLEAREKEQRSDLDELLERGLIVPKDYQTLTGPKDFLKAYTHRPTWILLPFPKQIRGVDRLDGLQDFPSRPMTNFNGHFDLLESEIRSYLKRGYEITLVSFSEERRKNLEEFVDRVGFPGRIGIREGTLSAGCEFPELKKCFLADSNLFGTTRRARPKKRTRSGQPLSSFTDLKVGDYVVHEDHGIGKFLGIEPLTIQGEKKDYLKIKYVGTDLLYIPVEQFDLVQKYVGQDGVAPKLNKLSGSEWKVTKAKARKAINDMTEELVALYAERQAAPGYAFGPDTVWQAEFEESFPYEETDDQLRAVQEIKEDMEKPIPMDRLLCGDVGFGKTEVAARAIFKCLAEGKQAALLAPTTLLADQHYYTLKERLEHFPFRVEMLSRFRTDAEQKEIVRGIAEGRVDLIIGTHRILSQDVKFRDLGLLVVDEEHRFGVAQKEKIKKLKKNVDVLSLSATPIPRTLNMSMTGIKNMSVLEEPPEDRYPVQTYVMEQDAAMIQEAIRRELERGGQVYVVYNRVSGINRIAQMIADLVPDARIAVGHGRMNEQRMESVMMDFVQGNTDVLVATTIIESGIDIPNANTMIILNADYFGLAQLYQLRGRVGRSNRIAYCYLMYQRDKVLTEVAEKRLRTIREFTEFGSGFKVAMRDLSIRGAGNLLGSEQSGHMTAIGYELYCKLVQEAVQRLQGKPIPEEPVEAKIDLVVSAGVPDWYIQDEAQKIEVYKKIADIASEEEEEELYDELVDRFGDVPRETRNLIQVSRIRKLAAAGGIERVSEQDGKIVFTFQSASSLRPEGVARIQDAFGGRALINAGARPFIRIPLRAKYRLEDSIRLLGALTGEAPERSGSGGAGDAAGPQNQHRQQETGGTHVIS